MTTPARWLWTLSVVVMGCGIQDVGGDPSAAGGGPTESMATSQELVSDSEIDSIQTQQEAITTTSAPSSTTTTATPAAFHLRLAWGYLAGKARPPEWVNWTGTAAVTSGTMQLEHLIFFEQRDFPLPAPAANELAWRSHTAPHFDGVVAKVAPGAVGDQVTISMPRFTHSFDVAALAQGSEQHFVVDNEGHEISVSAVPDQACNGFTFGYLRPHPLQGWMGFGGLVTNHKGERLGRLRFAAANGQILAKVVALDGTIHGTGRGTYDAAAKTFSITLTEPNGTVLATVDGLYVEPSYALRGSFQASWRCH